MTTTPRTDNATKDLHAVVQKIESWPEPFAAIGARIHEVVLRAGPKVKPRLWYGMPGYATGRSAPVLVFFRLDDGVMSLGVSERAGAERRPGTTLRSSAWFLEEIDEPTLEAVAEIARTAFARA